MLICKSLPKLFFYFVLLTVKILKKDGTEALPSELGRIVLKLPLPPGNMATLYRNDELFRKLYFQKFPASHTT